MKANPAKRTPEIGPLRPRGAARVLLAACCAALAVASAFHWRREEAMREAALEFAGRSGLDRTHPLETAAIRLEPAGDLAIALAVSTALPEPGQIAAAGSEERLAAARDRMLEAMAARPGWAYHRFLLGRVAWVEARRANSDTAGSGRRWLAPLASAAAAAPGVDLFWTFLGRALLNAWPLLDPAARADAERVLPFAFRDSEFVSGQLLPAVAALGRDHVFRLLPGASGPLLAAAETLARAGEVRQAVLLLPRISTALRRERAAGLRRIEATHRSGNVDDLREMCASWVNAYPPGEFDNAIGRRETARALELWPHFRAGTWKNDRRADLVRFFLDEREKSVAGDTLLRAIEALSGAPPFVAARVELLAGNAEEAEDLARASEAAGSLDWTPYFLQRALWELDRGRAEDARAAISRIASGARGECGVLLARRAVAEAVRDDAEAARVTEGLRSLRTEFYAADSWSRAGSLSLCLDPVWARESLLRVSLSAENPAVLAYGWNGGRSGTVFIEKSGVVDVPLSGLSGRNTFSVESFLGGPARPAGAAFVRAAKARLPENPRNTGGTGSVRALRAGRGVLRSAFSLHAPMR